MANIFRMLGYLSRILKHFNPLFHKKDEKNICIQIICVTLPSDGFRD